MDVEDDEEMEVELVFEAREIDLDYEFDAATFFDFIREESFAEVHEAEQWFDAAQSYPPSPFVAKLVIIEDGVINAPPKAKGVIENGATLLSDDEDDMGPKHRVMVKVDNYSNTAGLTFHNHTSTDKSKAKVKSKEKLTFPRSSTLVKSTASMLAKKNCPSQVGHYRFQMLLGQKEKSLLNTSVAESQAAKRRKLENGHLCKVSDAKQQPDFIHKTPKRAEALDKGSALSKPRLTVPREPALETAHRAQRMRPKIGAEIEHATATVRRFKAHPLNRKILEAPLLPLPKKSTPKLPEFQEFHLKTSERAMHHTSSVFTSSLQCNSSDMISAKPSTIYEAENGKREAKRPSTINALKQDGCSNTQAFKARPLNKKILSSKGDIGVFRNSKRETTVPVGFSFDTERRLLQNPPTDLFSKLSLKCELRPENVSQLQLSRPSCVSIKGSKENRLNPLQTEHKTTDLMKEKLPVFGRKQSQCGSSGCMNDIRNQLDALGHPLRVIEIQNSITLGIR